MNQKHPWEVADAPLMGDVSEDTIFLSIGRALTKWEEFEERYASIFSACVTSGVGYDTLPARRAYGSVISFQGRAAMVEAAAEAYLAVLGHDERYRSDKADIPTLDSAFWALSKLARNYSPRRNEIAHGSVQRWAHHHEDFGFALMPTSYSTNKHGLIEPGEGHYYHASIEFPKFIYSSKEIEAYAARFKELAETATALMGPFLSARRAT